MIVSGGELYQINARDIEIFAYHGVLPGEKENGQTFLVDFDIDLSEKVFPGDDKLEHAVDYALLVESINRIVTGAKYDLIETVCRKVLDYLMSVRGVDRATVTVKKPQAPLVVKAGWIGVTLSSGPEIRQ